MQCARAALCVPTLVCVHLCRGLFATHYHKLADAHADDPATSIRHMACHVADDGAGREQVASAARPWPQLKMFYTPKVKHGLHLMCKFV